MPIDFNPTHIFFGHNKPITPQVHQQQVALQTQPTTDVFVKQVQVKLTDVDRDYENMKIEQKSFGQLKNGENITLYTITNRNGASVDLSDFGATIVSIKVPDKNGKFIDVTQGYNSVTPYETSPVGHAGGTIGPCANKINKGTFTLGDKTYKLECNKDGGKTHSHGGTQGFDVKKWDAEIIRDGIKFTYNKADMESGYPGNIKATVTYKFDNENKLHIQYGAETDADTIINMTNHTYFNLDGAQNTQENSVYNHVVKLPNSSTYTVNSPIAVPTGEIAKTEGTPFDFSEAKAIKDVINSDFEQIKIGSGIDQNYVVDGYDGKKMIEVAEVYSANTGIKLEVSTNLPGFQLYTANHLGKTSQPAGKSGMRYEKRSALCVEPQFFPDAINTFDEKPILKKGETFNREIIYAFEVED